MPRLATGSFPAVTNAPVGRQAYAEDRGSLGESPFERVGDCPLARCAALEHDLVPRVSAIEWGDTVEAGAMVHTTLGYRRQFSGQFRDLFRNPGAT